RRPFESASGNSVISRYLHSKRRYRVCGDHNTRTVVVRPGSGFFPAQSEQNQTGVARSQSLEGWGASNGTSCSTRAATTSSEVLAQFASDGVVWLMIAGATSRQLNSSKYFTATPLAHKDVLKARFG